MLGDSQHLSCFPPTSPYTHTRTHTHTCSQAKRGGLKDTDAVDLLATLFTAVLERTRLEPQVRALCV